MRSATSDTPSTSTSTSTATTDGKPGFGWW